VSAAKLQARDLNAEAEVQGTLLAWGKAVAPHVLIFHIPNGGYRTAREAARLKWQGVLPGAPDLVIVAPGKICFAEVKTRTGRLSPAQRAVHHHLVSLGCPVAIVRSIDDMRAAFRAWGIATKEHDPLADLDPQTREAWRQSAREWRAERGETKEGE
jgi:VRR-NUC domain